MAIADSNCALLSARPSGWVDAINLPKDEARWRMIAALIKRDFTSE